MLHAVAFRPDPIADSRATADRGWFAVFLALAAGVHLALALAVPRNVHRPVASPRIITDVIDVEPQTEPTARAEPLPELPEPSAMPQRARVPMRPTKGAPPEPAAKVLTSAPGDGEPVDFVTGSAPLYTGGTTSRNGANTREPGLTAVASSPSVSSAMGTEPSLPDRSRPASLASGLDWRCPFPSRADRDGIDSGVASLKVEVAPTGQVRAVHVLHDSGHGFGKAARSCALRKRYRAALDRAGRSIGATLLVRVHFVR